MLNRSIRLSVIALATSAAAVDAQVVVTGTVTDSVNHRPLSGALVQLAGDTLRLAKSVVTDSLGVFRIDSVLPGPYIIGFFHATLDSLGLELSPKRLTVQGAAEQRVNLAIPSAATIAAQLCPAAVNRDSTGLLLRHLRDADSHMPLPGTVTVLWMELLIGKGGLQRNRQQIPIR